MPFFRFHPISPFARITSDAEKDLVVARANHIASYYFVSKSAQMHCLSYTVAVMLALMEKGVPVTIQAGNTQWKAISDEHDDGIQSNCLAYEWDPKSPFSSNALRQVLKLIAEKKSFDGKQPLPEMHIWAVPVLEEQVIDLTTKHFPAVFALATSRKWTMPPPPDYFWGTPEIGRSYEPMGEPCYLAMECAKHMLRDIEPILAEKFVQYIEDSMVLYRNRSRFS